MKRAHIISIGFIAVLIGTFIATFYSTSRSTTFAEADLRPEQECKISGTLNADFEIIYDPEVDPTKTVFHMTDRAGQTKRVVLSQPKPTGLENSESIDLYGSSQGTDFHANKMLMKCPSKYNQNNHIIVEDEGSIDEKAS